ncbi:sugar ABC transporter ATP-binding protein [Lichenihabitans sp. Uapishka_5]|uniref:sugar ABC transporter ATP-binding protein n=1 Tax=Lichenihabitans sp. Uapishka_5 TaxID=3037302 RepID=UPI0029E81207|nr:sugar ABC transporter ATP-binding protein [Lichenihabitans sp. Uapishka_5]MDX7950573.1 sugar ABC transporter ATP-binding protein [Lichenihabitans sp. Uapishka_5]
MSLPGEAAPLLRLRGIDKRYGGVQALTGVDLDVEAGRIHAILGENGAGKSSLIKCMAGVVQPEAGTMAVDGQPVRFASPMAANAAGVVCIFQELSLVPDLSVADNILISNPPRRFGMIDRGAQRRRAEAALARAGAADIHPMALVKDLPLSRRQLVEIAKALARNPRLLILDEATSALTAADVETVFRVLKDLRQEGLGLVYISHRMHEIAELADTCSVFRNGRHVETFAAGTKSDDAVVRMMIGRDYTHVYPPKPAPVPAAVQPVLEVRDLGWNGVLDGIDVTLRPGEILGLGGLDGQGQRELLLALFGVLRGVSGAIRIDGHAVNLHNPSDAKAPRNAVALIPEDRKTEGLMLPMSVSQNLSFAALNRVSRAGIVDRAIERRRVAEMVAMLAIKTADPDTTPVGTLSGGNQQKVVIAKWLMNDPKIILLNDPTRGIDVGTKQEIYRLLRRLAAEGAAIILYSTDYAELMGCCDRVLVMVEGRIGRELVGADITEHALVASALAMDSHGAAVGASV